LKILDNEIAFDISEVVADIGSDSGLFVDNGGSCLWSFLKRGNLVGIDSISPMFDHFHLLTISFVIILKPTVKNFLAINAGEFMGHLVA
jgi:hypothetical protein